MKLDRLLAITMLLLNRNRVSAKELSDRFEVSLRTVYRDMETITLSGIPIVSYPGADGGYEIMEAYRLERQYLSFEEMQSIIVALKGIRASLDEREVGHLLDKVGAMIAKTGASTEGADRSRQLIIDINPWQGGEAEQKLLDVLKGAIRDERLVRFGYVNIQGETTERDVEPMSIVLKGYVWYLFGYCRLREEPRIFRLSRIEGLALLADTFERRDVVPERLGYGWKRPDDQDCARLVLRFHPRAKARVRDYFVHGQIETEPDGTLLVSAVQPEEPWLYGMLLSFGTDVTIVEPRSVAEAVLHRAQEIVRKYESTLT